jgi:hypothetical protein
MFLLLDECCGKGLVQIAEDRGHTAQRTVEEGQNQFVEVDAHGAITSFTLPWCREQPRLTRPSINQLKRNAGAVGLRLSASFWRRPAVPG